MDWLRKLPWRRPSDVVQDAALVGGIGLCAIGAGLIYLPAGLIVAGVCLAAAALLAGPGDEDDA